MSTVSDLETEDTFWHLAMRTDYLHIANLIIQKVYAKYIA